MEAGSLILNLPGGSPMNQTKILVLFAVLVFLPAITGCVKPAGHGGSARASDREIVSAVAVLESSSATINVTESPHFVCSTCSLLDQTTKIQGAIADGIANRKAVYFPRGTYLVSQTIAKVGPDQLLVLKGESPSLTTIQLIAPLVINGVTRGLIEGVGGPTPGNPDKRRHARIEVSDMSFDARPSGGDYAQPGLQADCFRLWDVTHSKISSVWIRHFDGAAIRGYGWWDSVVTDTHFVKSGSASRQIAAVVLGARDGDNSGATNNISFTNCRWEGSFYVALRMMEGARKNHILGSKFHGILPDAAPHDHIQVVDSNSNTFSQNNVTNGGGSSFRILRSFGNNISGNTIGGQPGYAIYMRQSPRNVIVGNNLNTEASEDGAGDIYWDRNPGSTFLGNAGRSSCTLTGDKMLCGPSGDSSETLLKLVLD
jgi:hypothetical protein